MTNILIAWILLTFPFGVLSTNIIEKIVGNLGDGFYRWVITMMIAWWGIYFLIIS
jgi:hypothetical protein